MEQIDRIIFNFTDRCPNNCGFCYTPFNNKGKGPLGLWKGICKQINRFSPRVISFAGGDPFVYDDIYSLIDGLHTKAFINIDTCGLFIDTDKLRGIHSKIDAVGVPLDDTESMIKRQRFSPEQCNTVIANIEFLQSCGISVTIHTLLTPINKQHISEIADKLVAHNIHNWSVYQFWPFHFIKSKEKYCITDKEFVAIGNEIKGKYWSINATFKLYTQRHTGYFFVSSLGEVYTIDKNDILQYKNIGSIFDKNIYNKWVSSTDISGISERVSNKIMNEFPRL